MINKLITILGPTACGKTSFATKMAAQIDAEIISADSRQVYRKMDLGTGKDLADYVVEEKKIPYHLIDICEPGTKYNLFKYQEDFFKSYQLIQERKHHAILCGGTGLYIEAVLKGYHLSFVPQNTELRTKLADRSLNELTEILIELKKNNNSMMHNHSDVDSCQRAIRAIEIETYNLEHPSSMREYPSINSLIIGLDLEREERRRRIIIRLKERLKNGMVEEVKELLNSGISAEDLIYYGLEYKYLTEFIIGKLTYQEMVSKLEIAIHQFAKRQMTWFRGMERRGFKIHWLNALDSPADNINKVMNLL
jgi:tRNA dimethylallyltransferase